MTTPRYKRTKSLEERKERRKANQKKYRETHAEQIKAYQQRTKDAQKARMERFLYKNAETYKEYHRQYGKRNKDRRRARQIERDYGITIEQWNELFTKQGNKCAICLGIEPRGGKGWVTDHNHSTNRVRGVLCNVCNVMLGHGQDSIEIFQSAITYLTNPPFGG